MELIEPGYLNSGNHHSVNVVIRISPTKEVPTTFIDRGTNNLAELSVSIALEPEVGVTEMRDEVAVALALGVGSADDSVRSGIQDEFHSKIQNLRDSLLAFASATVASKPSFAWT